VRRGGQLEHKSKERKNPPAFEREGLVLASGVGVGVGVATSLSLVLVTWQCCLMLVMGGWQLAVVMWHGVVVGIGVAMSLVLQLAVGGCDMA
jgi:hypothetical protein